MPQELPDCSIDFGRAFSLPFGLPPSFVTGADLGQFQAELGVGAEFLAVFSRQVASW